MVAVSLFVILVNYNGLLDTLECLPTILASGINPDCVIVVDNGSTDDQSLAIQSAFPPIRVLRSETNLGWSGGNNLGAWEALRYGAEWIFLLNNDTILLEGWYERLRSVVVSDQWDVFGPVINEYKDPSQVQTEGVLFNRKSGKGFFDRISVPIFPTTEPTLTPCDIVNGCAVVVRASVFKRLEGIDNRFFLICEESDMCLRAVEMGARVGIMHESLVLHKHSVSFEKAGKPLQRYYSIRNLALLLSKHKTGNPRCSFVKTWLRYIRFCHHMASHEYELGNPAGVRAVAEGMSDAFLRRFGPKSKSSSFLTWCTHSFLRMSYVISSLK